MVCRGLMLALERAGHIELPPVRFKVRNHLAERPRPEPVVPDNRPVRGPLCELGPLEFQPVRRTSNEALFNSLMEQYHYLGYEQPVGEHVKYLVHARGQAIACLAWSSAPRHLANRDRFIGWNMETRKRGILHTLVELLTPSRNTEKTKSVLPQVSSYKESPAAKKPPRPGHGRNGANAFAGAQKVTIQHAKLNAGDVCPECERGKVYRQKEPKPLVRVIGQAPLAATVYELERLRCNGFRSTGWSLLRKQWLRSGLHRRTTGSGWTE
jgi:hypothetical protein